MLKKCQFRTNPCQYLGHIVGEGCVRPEEAKVKAMKDVRLPTTKKHLRTFLRLTGYYRRFIPDYAIIASPLSDLTRKLAPNLVQLSEQAKSSVRKLQTLFCSSPIFKSPDFTREFILQTDASD